MAKRVTNQPFSESPEPKHGDSSPSLIMNSSRWRLRDETPTTSPQNQRLTLLLLNIRSLRNKINELEATLCNIDAEIVCLSEHWLKTEELEILNLLNYKTGSYSARSDTTGGGTVILINQRLDIRPLDFLNVINVEKSIEICGIFIELLHFDRI